MREFSLSTKIQPREHNPVTLSMLFYLVTVAAILAACLRFIGPTKTTLAQYLWTSLLGSISGFLLGTALVLRKNNRVLAPVVGLFLGAAIGPIMCIHLSHFSSILAIAFGGGWIMVLLVCMAARRSSQRFSG